MSFDVGRCAGGQPDDPCPPVSQCCRTVKPRHTRLPVAAFHSPQPSVLPRAGALVPPAVPFLQVPFFHMPFCNSTHPLLNPSVPSLKPREDLQRESLSPTAQPGLMLSCCSFSSGFLCLPRSLWFSVRGRHLCTSHNSQLYVLPGTDLGISSEQTLRCQLGSVIKTNPGLPGRTGPLGGPGLFLGPSDVQGRVRHVVSRSDPGAESHESSFVW